MCYDICERIYYNMLITPLTSLIQVNLHNYLVEFIPSILWNQRKCTSRDYILSSRLWFLKYCSAYLNESFSLNFAIVKLKFIYLSKYGYKLWSRLLRECWHVPLQWQMIGPVFEVFCDPLLINKQVKKLLYI